MKLLALGPHYFLKTSTSFDYSTSSICCECIILEIWNKEQHFLTFIPAALICFISSIGFSEKKIRIIITWKNNYHCTYQKHNNCAKLKIQQWYRKYIKDANCLGKYSNTSPTSFNFPIICIIALRHMWHYWISFVRYPQFCVVWHEIIMKNCFSTKQSDSGFYSGFPGYQQPIKCKLLLSIYSQSRMVRYGEFGRWSLVGVKVCLTTNSPNTVHTFCSGQVGRIKVKIFGVKGIYLLLPNGMCIDLLQPLPYLTPTNDKIKNLEQTGVRGVVLLPYPSTKTIY